MRHLVVVLLLASFFATGTSAFADQRGRIVFRDTAYGVLTGALVGGALTLATDDPEEHLGYIGVGAAIGAVGGLAFGLYETTTLATVDEDGDLLLALPSVRIQPQGGGFGASVDLLRVDF